MLKKFTTAVCGFGLVLMTGGAVAAQTTTQEAAQKTNAAAQETAGAVSDTAITSAVKTRLAADKTVTASDIDVDTDDGVVTLTGHVASAAERARAVRLVRETKGVSRVVDKLTIGAATGTSGRADDATVTKDDETKIVIKDDTTPMIEKGVEKTKDAAKKVGEATDNAVKKGVDAVKDTDIKVKDDTRVEIHKDDGDPTVKTAGEATADAAITSAVKSKLLADARVSGLKIDVDTSKSVVTLTGRVATEAERAAALDLARSTTGVKRVIDKLTIK
jgi:hyperosmotically inducible protein